jgi:hypothetical protein
LGWSFNKGIIMDKHCSWEINNKSDIRNFEAGNVVEISGFVNGPGVYIYTWDNKLYGLKTPQAEKSFDCCLSVNPIRYFNTHTGAIDSFIGYKVIKVWNNLVNYIADRGVEGINPSTL